MLNLVFPGIADRWVDDYSALAPRELALCLNDCESEENDHVQREMLIITARRNFLMLNAGNSLAFPSF